ncbi:tetraacyldisaccharide 4'-kinase [Zunongwangia endophytica]|uniref:Tetraacyldisaccharide 4'-kinase n=1 Tax=Zunongwangia endophytica TaxID=1808945 RepID=A0ABV8H623_9FLAO|nr:tetraacyldisaccharide 4'-kinase [Zunongwangia endophytica]MDN3596542.1 tetraacyldisaccharide 4'-kinase [Zunongwangia endophytica]
MNLLRKLLFPFALVYGVIVWFRNKFFDARILKSTSYDFPVICVGNLSAGGTGKSPMIEYLLRKLNYKNIAVLSRGYKRSTEGFLLLNGNEQAIETGDEPLQFKTKFPEVKVAVDADRRNGIAELRKENAEIVLLDDAFQHRKVKAGFNILLTAYGDLYANDFMLPTGNLRETYSGADRAQVIVVTKCPKSITLKEREHIRFKLQIKQYQELYFSTIKYAEKISDGANEFLFDKLSNNYSVVTGIAKPEPFISFLKTKNANFEHLKFPDHHNFSDAEIASLNTKDCILTTEKDYMRLKDKVNTQLFYLPIETDFVENEQSFLKRINKFITESKA